ncbi:uncharacterized protein [Rutidosis leptorrhynchoides]|uniref:uncharacterized protein isoform X2 n=1 Tax=Rutidosis leptorrhynchoides TaxID=125765 RepID=UPI003A998788
MIRYLNSRWTNEQVNLITDMVSVRICVVFLKLFHKKIVAKHWNRLIKQVLINHIGIFYMSALQLETVYQDISLNSIILLGYNCSLRFKMNS